MRNVMRLAGVLVAVAGAAAAGVVVGGQVQEPDYPRMVVANRPEQAVPVSAEVTKLPAIRVEPTTSIQLAPDTIAALKENVVVRVVAGEWEYRELRAPNSPGAYKSLLGELTAAGAQGWETTGLSFSDKDATVVILKRQK